MPKRVSIEFVPCSDKDGLCLKFGGEPFGFPKALWPLSRRQKQPMQFICQIPFGPDLFSGTTESVAYLFMTHSDDADETWVPDGGENAVIILPREKLTDSLTEGDAPRLTRMVQKWWKKILQPEACIYTAKLTMTEDPAFIPDTERMELSDADGEAYHDALAGNKLGGSPGFLQGDELPILAPWHLLLQLDSAQVPFWINFGDVGIGYAFINGAGSEGKFLWQCA